MGKINNQRGITLVELIIAMALMGIVLIVAYNLLSSGLFSFNRQSENVDSQSKAREIVGEISKKIRQAEWNEIIVEDGGRLVKIKDTSYSFEGENNTVLKNDSILAKEIEDFIIEEMELERAIKLTIRTMARSGKEVKLSSTIYIRE